MAKFLFCSAALLGHLDFGGYLATAQELRSQGHTVIWMTGKQVKWRLDMQEIPSVLMPTMTSFPNHYPIKSMSSDEFKKYRAIRSLRLWLRFDVVSEAVSKILEVCKELRPNVIVTENCVPAAAIAAEILGIPLAVIGYPHGAIRQIPIDNPYFTDLLNLYTSQLNQIRRAFNLSLHKSTENEWMFFVSPYLHLTYFPPSWWYNSTDTIPLQAKFVGGTLITQKPKQKPTTLLSFADRRIVLITLGTVYTANLHLFEKTITTMVNDLNFACIITSSANASINFSFRTPYVKQFDWIDYEELFPFLDAVIHHAGIGTTHAAIRHGIPQIVFPQSSDQPYHAKKIAEHQLGIQISEQELLGNKLVGKLEEVLHNVKYSRSIMTFRSDIFDLGGIYSAASLLLQMADGNLPSLAVSHLPLLPNAPNDYQST